MPRRIPVKPITHASSMGKPAPASSSSLVSTNQNIRGTQMLSSLVSNTQRMETDQSQDTPQEMEVSSIRTEERNMEIADDIKLYMYAEQLDRYLEKFQCKLFGFVTSGSPNAIHNSELKFLFGWLNFLHSSDAIIGAFFKEYQGQLTSVRSMDLAMIDFLLSSSTQNITKAFLFHTNGLITPLVVSLERGALVAERNTSSYALFVDLLVLLFRGYEEVERNSVNVNEWGVSLPDSASFLLFINNYALKILKEIESLWQKSSDLQKLLSIMGAAFFNLPVFTSDTLEGIKMYLMEFRARNAIGNTVNCYLVNWVFRSIFHINDKLNEIQKTDASLGTISLFYGSLVALREFFNVMGRWETFTHDFHLTDESLPTEKFFFHQKHVPMIQKLISLNQLESRHQSDSTKSHRNMQNALTIYLSRKWENPETQIPQFFGMLLLYHMEISNRIQTNIRNSPHFSVLHRATQLSSYDAIVEQVFIREGFLTAEIQSIDPMASTDNESDEYEEKLPNVSEEILLKTIDPTKITIAKLKTLVEQAFEKPPEKLFDIWMPEVFSDLNTLMQTSIRIPEEFFKIILTNMDEIYTYAFPGYKRTLSFFLPMSVPFPEDNVRENVALSSHDKNTIRVIFDEYDSPTLLYFDTFSDNPIPRDVFMFLNRYGLEKSWLACFTSGIFDIKKFGGFLRAASPSLSTEDEIIIKGINDYIIKKGRYVLITAEDEEHRKDEILEKVLPSDIFLELFAFFSNPTGVFKYNTSIMKSVSTPAELVYRLKMCLDDTDFYFASSFNDVQFDENPTSYVLPSHTMLKRVHHTLEEEIESKTDKTAVFEQRLSALLSAIVVPRSKHPSISLTKKTTWTDRPKTNTYFLESVVCMRSMFLVFVYLLKGVLAQHDLYFDSEITVKIDGTEITKSMPSSKKQEILQKYVTLIQRSPPGPNSLLLIAILNDLAHRRTWSDGSDEEEKKKASLISNIGPLYYRSGEFEADDKTIKIFDAILFLFSDVSLQLWLKSTLSAVDGEFDVVSGIRHQILSLFEKPNLHKISLVLFFSLMPSCFWTIINGNQMEKENAKLLEHAVTFGNLNSEANAITDTIRNLDLLRTALVEHCRKPTLFPVELHKLIKLMETEILILAIRLVLLRSITNENASYPPPAAHNPKMDFGNISRAMTERILDRCIDMTKKKGSRFSHQMVKDIFGKSEDIEHK